MIVAATGKIVMRVLILAAFAALGLSDCASKSTDVTASYVSPLQYENLNCRQLAEEAQRISQRAAIAAGAQDDQRTRDQVATGVAIVVFWPAAFLVGGDKGNAAEL